MTSGGPSAGRSPRTRRFSSFPTKGFGCDCRRQSLTLVPDTNPADPYSRQFAAPALLPYLNAYPVPNRSEKIIDANGNHQGIAQFNASFSNPATLDAYSLRIDHKLTDKLNVFGRYNYSPSEFANRGGNTGTFALSALQTSRITTQTATVGATWIIEYDSH